MCPQFTDMSSEEMTKDHVTDLYFEAHITIEPVLRRRQRRRLEQLLKPYGFRLAKLLMRKRLRATSRRSRDDTFCTGRSVIYRDLEARTHNCVEALQDAGFAVWRYKIENTLVDVRIR